MSTSKRTFTRRSLMGGAAAGAAGALLEAPTVQAGGDKHAEVVVVGAGLAGLTAARRLVKKGRSVIVLEARDRVGGRTLNESIGHGKITELGGEFIGPTQNRIRKLADDVGVETFLTYDKGDNVFYGNGVKRRYSDKTPVTGGVPDDPDVLANAGIVVPMLDEMSTEVPVDEPWNAPDAAERDAQTFETWLRENSDYGKTGAGTWTKVVNAFIEALLGAEPRDISLLFVLFYIAAAGNEDNEGNLERLINTPNGAQERRFVGGSQRIAIRMAKQLGDRVMLGHPVRRISRANDGLRVHADGVTVRAERVIVAIPPTLAGRIAYDPPLPPERDLLTQRTPQGELRKVEAIYDRPFWRDDGLTGQAVADTRPVNITFDNSPPEGKPGILFGFVGGDDLRHFRRMSEKERRDAALDNFVTYFGEKARSPRDYFEHDWSDSPWTRGCPVGSPAPGVLFELRNAIREPVGRIHWAGTETSTFWNGYMDGAVRSGERAADEVLDKL